MTNLKDKSSLWREDFQAMQDNMSNRVFAMVRYINQYAEGITGANRNNIVLVGTEGEGFANKKEAAAYFKTHKNSFKSVTTQANRGYGALGTFYSKPVYIKGKDVLAWKESNYMDNCGYSTFKK